MTEHEKLTVLYEYAAGHLGTRDAIEQLGLQDYADLVIALSPMIWLFPSRRRHRRFSLTGSASVPFSCRD